MQYKEVEVEWSLTERGTVRMIVPVDAVDDEILEVFWDQELNVPADREDFDYSITEV